MHYKLRNYCYGNAGQRKNFSRIRTAYTYISRMNDLLFIISKLTTILRSVDIGARLLRYN